MTWDPKTRLRNEGGRGRSPVQKEAEVDRETWASLEKIQYEFDVSGTGEAIWGPVFFGRAYDSPPFFTHSGVAITGFQSGPRLTVGVSEWIQDEQNMYVGANLWVQLDSTWCNEPRRESLPCNDRRVSSFFSLDKHVEKHGRGPNGDEIPQSLLSIPPGTGFRNFSPFSDDSRAFPPNYGADRSYPDIKIEDTDPPTGATYHIYRPTTSPSVNIFLVSAVACGATDFPGSGTHLPYTSVLNPGALVTVKADAKSNVLTGTPQINLTHTFYEIDGTFISFLEDDTPLTTGYVTYQHQVTAPSNAHYWSTAVGWFSSSAIPDWSAGNFEIQVQ